MANWAAFVVLTVFVLLSMLALARLSRQAMGSDDAGGRDGDELTAEVRARTQSRPEAVMQTDSQAAPPHAGPDDTSPDLRLPRFESADHYAIRTRGRTPAVEDLSTGALLLNVALTQGLFGAVVAGAAIYFEIPARALGLGAEAVVLDAVAIGVALGVVLWTTTEVVGGVADAAGVGYDETVRGMLAPDSLGGWILLLGGILPTVAVVEELLFRGAAIGAVVAGSAIPVWAAVIGASLLFGVAHGAQGRVGMALATALGVVLATAFVATGSLLVVIVAHYLVNAIEFVVHEGFGLDPLGSG